MPSVISFAARVSSVRIQRLTVSLASFSQNSSFRTTPFISAKRVAFQSFVPKLR